MSEDAIDVGVDLGGTKIFAGLVARDGTLFDEVYVKHAEGGAAFTPRDEAEAAAGPAYARLCEVIEGRLATAAGMGRRVRGLAVGAPGVARPDGTIVSAPVLGWKDVALGALLSARFGLPARVENDVNLSALGEQAFGAARGARTVVLIAIGTGIGGAVIVDGRLWRGKHFAAGEIGGMLPGREFLSWRDRDWGALEGIASGTGIAGEARRVLAPELLSGQAANGPVTAESVFAAAAAGEAWATQIAEATLDHWSVAIAGVQAVLDPDVIVLSGGVVGEGDGLVAQIEARLAPALAVVPSIVVSALGYRAAVLGAPALLGAA